MPRPTSVCYASILENEKLTLNFSETVEVRDIKLDVYANVVDPDQTPRSVESDHLKLHCLSVSLLKAARLCQMMTISI